jgi:uncharacterized membrane protein
MDLRTITNIILILSVIGLVDAAYSTYDHYQILSGDNTGSFCDVSGEISCSAVNGSPYAEILGIPVALTGVLWFIVTIILAYQISKKPRKGFWENSAFYLFLWSIAGILSVVWFIYVELFLIGAVCILCTIVHIIVIIIAWLSYKLLQKPLGKYVENVFYE